MASTYLNRNASATATTFTYSVWLKRSGLASDFQYFFSYQSSGGGSNAYGLAFNGSTNKMYYYGTGGTATTDAVFRDPSAWYHVVLSVSSGTGTLYVNNETVKSSIAVNQVTSGEGMTIGAYKYGSTIDYQYDGYMAHAHFTDGYAYTPSTFGSTATNGQWVPTQTPSVTYGTNGFFLKFTNASDLGEDFSGNNNDFTKTGSGDKTNDNPQNVFATFNAIFKRTSVDPTFSQGNCKVVQTASNGIAYSTIGASSGKWYAEIKIDDVGTATSCGILEPSAYDNGNPDTQALYYQSNGNKNNKGSASSYGASYTTGDIIGIALDVDNGTLAFYKNGASQGTAFTGLDTNTTWLIGCHGYGGSGSQSANYGNPPFSIASGNADGNGKGTFEYAPPTNYLALCTDNLSSALTLPIGKGGSYMNTVLYTGNGADQSITGVGFQPDLVWIKSRSNGEGHWWGDSNRGVYLRLQSNTESAEYNTGPSGNNYPGVSSFDSDGFSVGRSDAANGNGNSNTAWNWRAGGSNVTNNDGTVTTTVNANTTSGFSIVTFTSPASGSYTLGHGLNSAPDLVIYKCRGTTSPWWTFYTLLDGSLDYMNLSSTAAGASDSAGLAVPTSTVFSLVGNYAPGSQTAVAYCFHSVEGYSKIDKYTGNGSTDGPFVYTGFRPKFLITKSIDSSAQGWTIQNPTNQTFNQIDNYLFTQSGGSLFTGYAKIDFLSNGFKMRDSDGQANASGHNILYIAFAENPFVDSSGIPVTAR